MYVLYFPYIPSRASQINSISEIWDATIFIFDLWLFSTLIEQKIIAVAGVYMLM